MDRNHPLQVLGSSIRWAHGNTPLRQPLRDYEKLCEDPLVFSGAEGVIEVVGGGVRVEVTGEALSVEDVSGADAGA